MSQRPNILLLMADQLNPAFLPMYGNGIVQAPNLQALAARGTVFANAYCNYPICAPSRYSMLSGRLPHSIKAFDNASEFSAATPTLMHYLRQQGYKTALAGKMHFVGPDQLHGFEERLLTDIYPADFAWVPDWTQGPRNAPTGISMRAVIEAGVCQRSLQIDYDDETEFHAQRKLWDLARGDRKQPFFLTVSFSHPHSPFTASEEHWNRYRHEDIDMPAVGALPLDQLDKHSEWLYYSHGRDRYIVSADHVRNARHAYYGMISYVDDKVGRLLDILRRTGMEDDTLVIFTSDHGEMMGERGMWFKQCFFEGSVRVPLLAAGAGWNGRGQCDALVSLVDLMPTLLEVACAEAPEAHLSQHGQSLLPLAQGNDIKPRHVISEYSDMGVCSPGRMVRDGRHKLIYTHGHPVQLFDLVDDPHELHNLSGESAMAETESHLLRLLMVDWNPEQILQRVLDSQADRQLIQSVSSGSIKSHNWSWMARTDDDRRYVRSGGDAEGTVATKGRARYPYVSPAQADRSAPSDSELK